MAVRPSAYRDLPAGGARSDPSLEGVLVVGIIIAVVILAYLAIIVAGSMYLRRRI